MNDLAVQQKHIASDFENRSLISVDAEKFHQFIKMVEKLKDRNDELEQKEREYRENEFDLDNIIDRLRR